LLADRFFDNARTLQNQTAIWNDGHSVTYGELEKMVRNISESFINCGIKYGDHVGIIMHNSITFVAVMLAIANIGAAMAPLNPRLQKQAILKAFYSADVKHIVAPSSFLDEIKDIESFQGAFLSYNENDKNIMTISEFAKSRIQSSSQQETKEITGDEPYILSMTSGSISAPKPIIFTQRTKYNRVNSAAEIYGITSNDRILVATPMFHSLSQRFVLVPLLLGGTSILMTRYSPELWIKTVSEERVSFTVAFSSQLALISSILPKVSSFQMDSLRCIASSLAPISPEVKAELLANLSCEIHENYGTSEVSFISDLNITTDNHKLRSVGRPIPRVEVRIMKEDGTEAAVGEKGEIQCNTPFLFGGYYKNPEQTEKSMQEGYFRTGDLGYMDEEGYLYYSGRTKDMIVTGAIKVFPVDIEKAVMELSSVRECAAFGFPDERLGEVVALAVVPEQHEALSIRELKSHCLENLADYQMPRKYFITDSLPKNAMGKLVRGEIVEKFKGNKDNGV